MLSVKDFYSAWCESDGYCDESAIESQEYADLGEKISDSVGAEKYRNELEDQIMDVACDIQISAYNAGFRDAVNFVNQILDDSRKGEIAKEAEIGKLDEHDLQEMQEETARNHEELMELVNEMKPSLCYLIESEFSTETINMLNARLDVIDGLVKRNMDAANYRKIKDDIATLLVGVSYDFFEQGILRGICVSKAGAL